MMKGRDKPAKPAPPSFDSANDGNDEAVGVLQNHITLQRDDVGTGDGHTKHALLLGSSIHDGHDHRLAVQAVSDGELLGNAVTGDGSGEDIGALTSVELGKGHSGGIQRHGRVIDELPVGVPILGALHDGNDDVGGDFGENIEFCHI